MTPNTRKRPLTCTESILNKVLEEIRDRDMLNTPSKRDKLQRNVDILTGQNEMLEDKLTEMVRRDITRGAKA